MEILNTDTALVPIENITPHPANPRQGDVGAIHESIRHNGFWGSVVVQRSTGYILAGNHRWQAAKAAGAQQIPVTYVDVPDDHAARILLADNRTNDLATYNDQALADLLTSLADTTGTLDGTGYDGDDLDDLLRDLGHDTTPPAEPGADVSRADELAETWGVTPGQLWRIGDHRLLCADSTDPTSWQRLMRGETADMLNTDPPYGVAVAGGTRDPRDTKNFRSGNEVENDASIEEALRVTRAVLTLARDHLHPGSSFYIWHASTAGYEFASLTADVLGQVRSILIWAKDNFVFGRQDYHWQHEPCLYGWLPGAAHAWHGTRDQGTIWRVDAVGTDLEKKLHPTAKPVELARRAIRNSSAHGQLIIDPFSGAGGTIVAAHQIGRRCYALEYEPKYVAVTLQRLTEMGLTPELTDD